MSIHACMVIAVQGHGYTVDGHTPKLHVFLALTALLLYCIWKTAAVQDNKKEATQKQNDNME